MITIFSIQQGPGFGAEVVLSALLQAWPPDAEPLTIVAPPGSAASESARQAGHRVVSLPSTRDSLLANWRAAGAVAEDVAGTRRVHAWAARGFEGARHLAARLRVPCSGTLHDHPAAGFHGSLRRRVMRHAADRFDGLACVSQAVRQACGEAGYRGSMSVIRNGLADRDAPPSRTREGPVRIGFLGMYAPWKGFDVIEGWVRNTDDVAAEWQLYGEVGPELEDRAANLVEAYGGRVRLLGRRPPDEIFAEIDLIAHASSGFDPLPTVLIEAARAGIPAVACDLGGAREIVDDGETGFLFAPDDTELGLKKLRELITDNTLRARQTTAAGRKFRSAFSVSRMVREYASFW